MIPRYPPPMGSALIRIDQPTNPTTPVGQPGVARKDLVLGQPVVLRNSDDTDVSRWIWALVDQPLTSTAILSGTSSSQVTFTPDVAGSYLIRLTVGDGLAGQIDLRVAAILDTAGYRYPATGETADSVNWPDNDEKGWGKDVEAILREAAAGGSLAGTLAIGNTTGGTSIEISNGDEIVGEDGGSISFAPTSGDIVLSGKIVSPDGSASAGEPLELEAGAGNGAGQPGGNASLTGGAGAAGGGGGTASLTGGTGGATSGAGGATSVQGGSAIAGNSAGGDLSLGGGQPSGSGAPGDIAITAFGALLGNVAGGTIEANAGDGSGSGVGGSITATAGDGGATAAGGVVDFTAGDGGATGGAGGTATLRAGSATASDSAGGAASLLAGVGSGIQTGGVGLVQAGDGGATGDGGPAILQAGNGGATSGSGGSAFVSAGSGVGPAATGGSVEVMAGPGGSGAAQGGSIAVTSGDGGGASGNSGGITIASGQINSGTRGTITLDASDVIISSQAYHSVRGSTARGSTNTLIYRWTSVVEAVGTGITYTDSATAGGSWAINEEGIYTVSMSIDAGHNGYIAIKKAAAVSNTFDATDIMLAGEALVGIAMSLTWTGYCAVGADIWIATNTTTNPTGTPVNNQRCHVVRVR
jgi:hypothetical protein